MKAKGYMGKILRVDLTSRKFVVERLTDKVAEQFIGGCGLGTKILYEETAVGIDPLGPENLLIFASGPMNGTMAFNSDRFDVVSKSPLTGIFAESRIIDLPASFLRYLIHGIPEISAYFTAGLAGGIISVAVIKHHFKQEKFWHVLYDSISLIILAIIILFIAALIEVFITPALF